MTSRGGAAGHPSGRGVPQAREPRSKATTAITTAATVSASRKATLAPTANSCTSSSP